MVVVPSGGAPAYPWYLEVNGPGLEQGDLIHGCPVIVPSAPSAVGPIESETKERVGGQIFDYDLVIMTQSCDLLHEKVKFVLACSLFSYSKLASSDNHLASKKGKQELTNGYLPGFHLLAPCKIAGFESDHQVVIFRDAVVIPKAYLAEVVAVRPRRIRLLPPYREQLSQAFARFFMRVGLPVDVPPL